MPMISQCVELAALWTLVALSITFALLACMAADTLYISIQVAKLAILTGKRAK